MSRAGETTNAADPAPMATIRSALVDRLREATDRDPEVASALRAWSEGTGVGATAEATERASARQASVLANRARYRAIVGREPPPALRETPVSPFDGVSTPPVVEAATGDVAEAAAADPDADAHLVGADYADALADEERRTRGQFYTPRPVAEFVVDWAMEAPVAGDAPPRVLDPAAGTGTFPLAAYGALRKRHPNVDPTELRSRLVAVDVDETALHLAALRLSARSGGTPVEEFDRRQRSFFDLEPGRDVERVDAVVGNPPFVRARELAPGREHFRAHLDALGPEGEAPYADGERALSRRSDASVYFVTQATRFLRPGGRLGLVLPAKWLESEYGVGFRRFLADHYRVEAVVGFGARTFDALVDTVLLLAERRERLAGADDATVRFVRLDGGFDAAEVRGRLDGGRDAGTTSSDADGTRTVRRSQGTFAAARQCSPYLRAPAELLELLDHPDLVPLGDLAAVSRGVTTGANAFFLLDADDRDRWGIDDRFLGPVVRSIRGVETRSIDGGDVERSILDVHGFLADRLDGGPADRGASTSADESPSARAKAALRDTGHGGLADYVEDAEADGVHERRTCRSRRVWFDLGELEAPDAFVPKLLRERVFTVRNRAGAIPTNAIDCLSVRAGIDPGLLLGVLDSSLCRATMEVWGRDEAGLLQLMTAETRTLPVPDVREFSPSERAAIHDAARDLRADGTGQAALDAAVLDALDVDLGAERVRTLREGLLQRRVEGSGRAGDS